MLQRSFESVDCIGHRSHHFDSDPDPGPHQSEKSGPDPHQGGKSDPDPDRDPHHSETGIRILIMEVRTRNTVKNYMQDRLTVLVPAFSSFPML